jgi:hypothetical protein
VAFTLTLPPEPSDAQEAGALIIASAIGLIVGCRWLIKAKRAAAERAQLATEATPPKAASESPEDSQPLAPGF